MANKELGEIEFESGGVSYVLCFSINAQCRLRDRSELTMLSLARLFDAAGVNGAVDIDPREWRLFFWSGLTDNHPDLTEEDAGRIMTALGMVRTADVIGKAYVASLPRKEDLPIRPFSEGERSGAEDPGSVDFTSLWAEWISHGFEPSTFWRQTQRTIIVHFKAIATRNRRLHNGNVWLAYHTGVFVRLASNGKMPEMEKFLLPDGPKRPQTPEQQMHIMKLLTVQMNGKLN